VWKCFANKSADTRATEDRDADGAALDAELRVRYRVGFAFASMSVAAPT